MLHLLYEAPEVAAAADDDEDPRPTRTKTRSGAFDHLDDLDQFATQQPLAAYNEPKDNQSSAKANPELRRASASDTRARTSNIVPGEVMRDYLNRVRFTASDDEIDDAEAARRRDPVQNTQVDRVRPAEVPAILNRQLRAAGEQMPEWHTINNLPGYGLRNIRGMGREFFRMFTRTPLEQILTIANVEGRGPNTDDEIRAVTAWLRDNGQDRGRFEVDMGPAIQSYRPDVREYTAMGMRFHVVQDRMGQYVYAYPEQDARTHQNPTSIGPAPSPQLTRESKTTMNLSEQLLSEQLQEELRYHRAETAVCREWTAELIESLIQESSLGKLIGDTPGGQNLVRFMHRRHKLSNFANWEEHPFDERIMWTEFKDHPDKFMIISASQGVAAIRPYEQDMIANRRKKEAKGETYNPAHDPTLRYQIVAFRKDEQVDPALLRGDDDTEREADPTVMRARGGLPQKADVRNPDNIFDRIQDQIGRLQSIYISKSSYVTIGAQQRKQVGRGRYTGIPEPITVDTLPVLYKKGTSQYIWKRENRVPALLRSRDPKGFIVDQSIGDPVKVVGWLELPKDESGIGIEFTAPINLTSGNTLTFTHPKYEPVPLRSTPGGVEREKIAGRVPPEETRADYEQELTVTINRLRPVLKKLANQAFGIIKKRIERYNAGGNYEQAQEITKKAIALQKFLAAIDVSSSADINNMVTRDLIGAAVRAAARQDNLPASEWLRSVNQGKITDIAPVLDAVRAKLMDPV